LLRFLRSVRSFILLAFFPVFAVLPHFDLAATECARVVQHDEASLAAGRGDWLTAWKKLNPDSEVEGISRNLPVCQPVLWVR